MAHNEGSPKKRSRVDKSPARAPAAVLGPHGGMVNDEDEDLSGPEDGPIQIVPLSANRRKVRAAEHRKAAHDDSDDGDVSGPEEGGMAAHATVAAAQRQEPVNCGRYKHTDSDDLSGPDENDPEHDDLQVARRATEGVGVQSTCHDQMAPAQHWRDHGARASLNGGASDVRRSPDEADVADDEEGMLSGEDDEGDFGAGNGLDSDGPPDVMDFESKHREIQERHATAMEMIIAKYEKKGRELESGEATGDIVDIDTLTIVEDNHELAQMADGSFGNLTAPKRGEARRRDPIPAVATRVDAPGSPASPTHDATETVDDDSPSECDPVNGCNKSFCFYCAILK